MSNTTTAPGTDPAAPTAAADAAPTAPEISDDYFFTEAERIREAAEYDGTLTGKLLRDLQPLLKAPIPPKYIDRIPPTTGKPYESTGVKSVQVQVDRMNDVLGLEHWRWLPFYAEEGKVCRVIVIVGNKLAGVRVDERGDLDPASLEGAEILVVRDGWGGHSRGSGKGDILKGSETNTLKRVLARVGPGCDIYRLDYDLDTHNSGEEYTPEGGVKPVVGGSPLSAGQVRLIRARARDAGISDAQLCNICLRAAGMPLVTDGEAVEAMNGGMLERMPKTLVDPVLAGIAQGPPPPIAAPASPLQVPPSDIPVEMPPAEPHAMAPVAHLTTAAALVPPAAVPVEAPGDTMFPPADIAPPAAAPLVGQPAPVTQLFAQPGQTAAPMGDPQAIGAPQPPTGQTIAAPQPPAAGAPTLPPIAPSSPQEPAHPGELGPVDRDAALAHLSFANAAPGAGPAAIVPTPGQEQAA